MAFLICLLSLFMFPTFPPSNSSALNQGTLNIQICNIEKVKGNILIAVFDEGGGFPESGGEVFSDIIKVEHLPDLQVKIPQLPYGKYAVAVYHDLNKNHKLDKNLMGIPVEPYGFSNNPKVKWRAPTFQDALFEFTKNQTKLNITLKKWKHQ